MREGFHLLQKPNVAFSLSVPDLLRLITTLRCDLPSLDRCGSI